MRFAASMLLLTACSQPPAEPSLATGTFSGDGRDRLCIAGQPGAYRAGLIAYAPENINCSATGSLQPAGPAWVLVPRGEDDCRIPLAINGKTVRVGSPPASCDYYCGPGATMAGKMFSQSEIATEAVDLAGDPLC